MSRPKTTKHTVKFAKFTISIIDRDIDTIVFKHTSDPYNNQVQPNWVNNLETHLNELYFNLTLPIFLKKNKRYILVGRRYLIHKILAMDDNGEKKIVKFPAIIVSDEADADNIKKMVGLEYEYLNNSAALNVETPDLAVSAVLEIQVPSQSMETITTIPKELPVAKSPSPPKHRLTNERRIAKDHGQVCPFCGGPIGILLRQEKKISKEKHQHPLKCEYRSNEMYRCGFAAAITDVENEILTSPDGLPTHKFFSIIPDDKCECGSDVYLRTMHLDNGSIETYRRCWKFHSVTEPYYSIYEFKTAESLALGRSPQQLQKDILASGIMPLPNTKRSGIPWLRALLLLPALYENLVNIYKPTLPTYVNILANKTASYRQAALKQPVGQINEKQMANKRNSVAILNRMAIEQLFTASPKLYEADGKICKMNKHIE